MDFAMLAVIMMAGLVGPLLAYPQGWHVPVVVGELIMGILLGRTALGYLDASDPTFSFLAEVGFGLVMFVALAVIATGAILVAVLSFPERKGYRHRLHRVSEQRHLLPERRRLTRPSSHTGSSEE
jgi:hypothetical protein